MGRGLHGKHIKPDQVYELEDANNRLEDIFRNHDFNILNHSQRLQLAQFYRLLMTTQEKYNFTRLLKFRDIAIKHFIDSLIITQLTDFQFPLLDLGTGPGLPGIPLKIFFPDQKILLAEGVQKRVEFLKQVRSELELKKLDIIGRNINSEFVYPTQSVITRAVEDIGNTFQNVMGSLQVGGRVYFMKGPSVDPEIKMALNKWASFYRLIDDIPYSLPQTPHQRRLLIFEKIKHQPLFDEPNEPPPVWSTELRQYLKDRGD